MKTKRNAIALVGVLKNISDLDVVLRERWYRIPLAHAPKKTFEYIAFYQPAVFGRLGRCIRYYARVTGTRVVTRERLLPNEPAHPRARLPYVRVQLGRIQRLTRPVRNIIPRRVTFGFTTLKLLRSSRDLLQLYNIAPIEQILEDALRRAGIRARPQQTIRIGTRRFRPDFLIETKRGPLAIECDNITSHRSRTHQKRDREKDNIMRRAGWRIVRLTERQITIDTARCVRYIRYAMHQSF